MLEQEDAFKSIYYDQRGCSYFIFFFQADALLIYKIKYSLNYLLNLVFLSTPRILDVSGSIRGSACFSPTLAYEMDNPCSHSCRILRASISYLDGIAPSPLICNRRRRDDIGQIRTIIVLEITVLASSTQECPPWK